MYAYWYEDGQIKFYEGAVPDFNVHEDISPIYTYAEFKSMPIDWYKTEVIMGSNSICNIFAEDVPSDIRAMHLLLVKE